jgi:hypothetical protein
MHLRAKEQTQRKAFTEFLQTRIIDKPGVHMPVLTEEEKKAFGDCSLQYEVMQNFHAFLNEYAQGPLTDAMKQMNIRSVSDAITHRKNIQSAQKILADLPALIAAEQAKADNTRASFNQPDDLKRVYDKAYTKLITQPADAIKDMMPIAGETLTATLETLDYISAHSEVITVNGTVISVSDPAIKKELNAHLKTMNLKAQATMQAQRTLTALVYSRG